MKHFLLSAGALVGAVLLLTSAADAGDRDGRARSARSGPPSTVARGTRSAPTPSRMTPSRTPTQRAFTAPRTTTTFPSRVQVPSRNQVPFNSTRWRQDRAGQPSTFTRAPTTSQPAVLYGSRSRTGTRAPTTSSPWVARGTSPTTATQLAAQRTRDQASVSRLRSRTTTAPAGTTFTAPATRVSGRGIGASSRGDTATLRSRTFGTSGSGATTFRSGSTRATGSRLGATGFTGDRVGTTRVTGSRFGTRSAGLGTTSARAAIVGSTSRSAVGGSVRVRPGTRGRVGRSYRIAGAHHHHGHYVSPWLGFYYSWAPYYPSYYPYYRAYPSYGLYFGYGVSYYGPAYETVFVDAVDYDPGEVIIREEIVQQGPVVQGPAPAQPAAPVEDFPAPAPAGDVPADGDQAARAPHPDFEPAVQAFLGGRYQEALTRLDRVIAAEPDNGEAWLAVMHANFALGRYGPAGLALAEAAAFDAFPRGYRFDVRPLYAQQDGSYDRYVQALGAHLVRTPRDADALLLRAYLHLAQGERGPARQALDMVLEVRPADETAPRLAMALLPPPPPPADAKNAR